MKRLVFVTGNATKFHAAAVICQQFGVQLAQMSLDIPEIQATDGEIIARDKADKAYAAFQKPLVVSDDSWLIPGLNDFPGPYMKFMNDWLGEDDWLHLTAPLTDRRVVLRQYAVYQDARMQQAFYRDVEGILLSEPLGSHEFKAMTLVSFDGGKTSAAQAISTRQSALVYAKRETTWHDLCTWLATQK